MLNDQSNPVEGKGAEMMPERGFPFNPDEISEVEATAEGAQALASPQEELPYEDPSMMSTALTLAELQQLENELAESFAAPAAAPGVLSLADDQPAEMAATARVPRALTEAEMRAITGEPETPPAPFEIPPAQDLVAPGEAEAWLAQLAEDAAAGPGPMPGVLSLGGEEEVDFAASRQPIPISHAEMEAMMQESGEIPQSEPEEKTALMGSRTYEDETGGAPLGVLSISAEGEQPPLEPLLMLTEFQDAEPPTPEPAAQPGIAYTLTAEPTPEELALMVGGDPEALLSDSSMLTAEVSPEEVASYYAGESEAPAEEGLALAGEPGDGGMGAAFYVSEAELAAQPGMPAAPLSVPPPEAMRGAPLFGAAAYLAPGPTEGLEGAEAPELAGDLEPEKELLDIFVTEARLNALWNRADQAQQKVIESINDLTVSRLLLNQLRSAKTLMLSKKSNYEEAERAINEVEFRIAYSVKAVSWTRLGYWLFAYETLWGILLAVGMLYLPPIMRHVVENASSLLSVVFMGMKFQLSFPTFISADDVFNAVGATMWGGLGGVVGAMYALWRYISREQNFTPQHTMWYIAQPIMGIPIGAFIFLFIELGFSFISGTSTQTATSPYVLYLLAWIAGFQQNVLYDIVRQVLKRFKIKGEEEGEEEEPLQETKA